MIWSISSSVSGALVDSPSLGNPGTFGQVSNIGAVISSFLPVGEISNVAGVSKGWAYGAGVEFKQVVRELKDWKDGGGLIITVFGNPTNEDMSNLWRLKDSGLIDFNQLGYQHIVSLFIEYIRINGADADELDRLSASARTAIDAHPNLTGSQKNLLVEVLLPNIPLNEVRLSQGYLSGGCQCDARHLEDRRGQYSRCQCFCRLSNDDLRRLTPRFIARADEVTSSENFITLYVAHNETMTWRVFFKPMDYPNAEVLRLLEQKLTEELNSGRITGTDLMKLTGLFSMLKNWERAEQSMEKFVAEQDSFKMWLQANLMKQCFFGITKPLIQYGTTIPWVASKAWGGVKRLAGK